MFPSVPGSTDLAQLSRFPPLTTGRFSRAFGVAVDRKYIYWTNFNSTSIGRANLDGSSPNQNFISGQSGKPTGVAVDGSYIYLTDEGGFIRRGNLDGTGVFIFDIPGAEARAGVAVGSR